MARVSISVPDEVVARAKTARLNISRLATDALAEELDRQEKIDALDRHLAELDERLGPVSEEQAAAADRWAAQFDAPAEATPASA